jgi:predicted Zn-dependent protease
MNYHRTLPGIIILLLLVVTACSKAPYTGRERLLLLSEKQELNMGAQSFQALMKTNKKKINRDPTINAHVRRVGERIARASGKNYKWEFVVIQQDKTPNAFVLPGGKVFVYTGILPLTLNEHGLAAVMGHEVAHAIARHGGERVSQQILVSTSMVAVSLALSKSESRTSRLTMAALGAGVTVGVMLPFSRLHESEADRLGLIFMAKAGYDPRRAVDFWRRMKEHSRKNSGNVPPEFLSTHPSGSTRIRDIQRWLPEALKYYRPQG